MLKAVNITRSYRDLKVLKGIHLEVAKGEMICIIGVSGSGKSTLLHILGTLDQPDSGKIEIAGTDTTKLKDRELAHFRNNKIGFVFQFHNLLPEFTALENVCLPAFIGKRAENEVKQEAMKWMDMLGISARANHKPSELSGGEQQRVAVARALINRPDIIFADEPSGNLDSHNASELHQLFMQLKKDFGQTFVVVTHNPQLAEMADRTLEIRDGIIAV